MRRCKSDSSLSTMSKEPRGFEKAIPQYQSFYCPNNYEEMNPYDSDSWHEMVFGVENDNPFSITDAQTLPPDARGPYNIPDGDEYSDSETYSEYPEPVTQTDPTEQTIHFTDLSNCREVLATLSNFNSGQIGQYLKSHQGLLILPLHAVSIFRIPHGHHTGNYPIIIYYPTQNLDRYPHLSNFNEAINALYTNQQ